MNTCKLKNVIIPYIDGELSRAEAAKIASHLETCAACRETLSLVRTMKTLAGAYQRPPFPEKEKESFYRALDRQFPTGRGRLFSSISRWKGMRGWKPALVIPTAAALIVLAFLTGNYAGRSSRETPIVLQSQTLVVQNDLPHIERFLQEAETLLLNLKEGSGKEIACENVRQARDLIEQLPVVHDAAVENSNAALLSFLVQSELILYEAAHYQEDSVPAVRDLIRRGAGSERLWEALKAVRKSLGAGTPAVMSA
ncbi:zf-HC2 domain-containing protein [bacterium]|nr:zf-HC2 domain-containing protein [bacterium]